MHLTNYVSYLYPVLKIKVRLPLIQKQMTREYYRWEGVKRLALYRVEYVLCIQNGKKIKDQGSIWVGGGKGCQKKGIITWKGYLRGWNKYYGIQIIYWGTRNNLVCGCPLMNICRGYKISKGASSWGKYTRVVVVAVISERKDSVKNTTTEPFTRM